MGHKCQRWEIIQHKESDPGSLVFIKLIECKDELFVRELSVCDNEIDRHKWFSIKVDFCPFCGKDLRKQPQSYGNSAVDHGSIGGLYTWPHVTNEYVDRSIHGGLAGVTDDDHTHCLTNEYNKMRKGEIKWL